MSWIFALCLCGYASLWLVLWLRGSLRWARHKANFESPPPACEAPAHLSGELQERFAETYQLCLQLWEHRRRLERALVVEPDVKMGGLRGSDLRRSTISASQELGRWLRKVDALHAKAKTEFLCSGSPILELRAFNEHLRQSARRLGNSRALELHPIDFVQGVRTTLGQTQSALEQLLALHTEVGPTPYRAELHA